MDRHIEIAPYSHVGPIRLGMAKDEVHSAFGPRVKSFQKADERVPSDVVDESVFIYYDDIGHAEGIELAPPAEPLFEGQPILGRPFSEVRAWLRHLDPELEIDGSGAVSRRIGISVYAPSALKEPDAPVEAVMIFRRGYYD